MGLDIHAYAALTVTGAVGTIYSIEYVPELAQANSGTASQILGVLDKNVGVTIYALGDSKSPLTFALSQREREQLSTGPWNSLDGETFPRQQRGLKRQPTGMSALLENSESPSPLPGEVSAAGWRNQGHGNFVRRS